MTDVRDAIDAMPEIPPVVQGWIRQLLDAELLALMRVHGAGQVDVRLSAAGGKVRTRPAVTLNGGPQQYADPNPTPDN